MNKKIKLADLVKALQIAEEKRGYIDTAEGTIRFYDDAHTEGEVHDGEEKRLEEVFAIEDNWQRFVVLPDVYDVYERDFLADFLTDQLQDQDLVSMLHQYGGVRKVKRHLQANGLSAEWGKFLEQKLYQFARDWCDDNAVDYEE